VVEVRRGGYPIAACPKDDLGLRDLIAPTESKVAAKAVAELFGLSQPSGCRSRTWRSSPSTRP
jgi:hypothetical protein